VERLRYASLRWGTGLAERLRLRLTPAGWLAFGGWAVAGAMSVDSERSAAYMIFSLLSGLWMWALAGIWFFRPRARAVRKLPRYATAGEPFVYRWSVLNDGDSPLRGARLRERLPRTIPSYAAFRSTAGRFDESRTAVERVSGYGRWRALMRRAAVATEACLLPDAGPGESVEAAARAVPARRGRIDLSGAVFERVESLVLLRSFSQCPAADHALVLPRRYPVGRLALPGSRRYQPGGVALASRIGESPEFIGLRDYRPGDPLRRIDWKSWAKEGKPIVREYRDEQFVRHALVLDTFAAPGREEHFEEAVSVAASFAATVLTQESLLDLLFVVDKAYCVTAGRGVGSAARMLEVLAGVERCAAQSFSVLSVSVLRRAATLTGCLLVLTDYDASRREMLESLQALGIPVRAFVICDSTTQAESSWGPSVRRIEIGRAAEGLALP